MHVVFSADHAGFPLKETLIRVVADAGYSVEDLGTYSTDPVDYPDFAAAVAREVAAGRADKGIIITTGTFTLDAKKEARRDGVPPIELVDGDLLVQMFERLELGIVPRTTYTVDEKFFEDFKK